MNFSRTPIIALLALHGAFAADALLASEILGRPTDQGVTLNAIAGFAADAYIKYGLSGSALSDSTAVQSFAADLPMVLELNSLQPNQKYDYQLIYRRQGTSAWNVANLHSFQTQRSTGSSFSFNIIADAHMHDKKGIPSVMIQTMNNQLQNVPDFLIDMGDNFGDDHNPTTISKDELWANRLNMRKYYGMLNHSSPLFLVMGNHEGESGYWLQNGGTNQMALNATLGRKYYYNNPAPNAFYSGNTVSEGNGVGLPENYYAWTWGDALFVVLDGYRGYTVSAKPRSWEWTLGKAQYDWFKQTLEQSPAKYKFVFAHHVLGETRGGFNVANLYEWGGYSDSTKTKYDFDNQRPGWGLPIHQLMVQNHVNIFFQGHDHLFARETVDGVVYQTCPMPSDSSYRIGIHDNGDAFVSDTLEGSGFVSVHVGPEQTSVDYVTTYLSKDETSTRKNNAKAFSYALSAAGNQVVIRDQSSLKSSLSAVLSAQSFAFQSSKEMAYQLQILNVQGKLVFGQEGRSAAGINTLRFEKILPQGSYYLNFEMGQQKLSTRVQLQGLQIPLH